MSEKLDTSSEIVIFGRKVDDLTVTAAGQKNFVRAYGFSFDGQYYEVPTPVLLLLNGAGVPAKDATVPGPNPRDKAFVAVLKAWTVSRQDQTVRLDVDSGKFEHLLLDPAGDGNSRVSGARVSGARVSGARVSGARVSGARVSGARGDASD